MSGINLNFIKEKFSKEISSITKREELVSLFRNNGYHLSNEEIDKIKIFEAKLPAQKSGEYKGKKVTLYRPFRIKHKRFKFKVYVEDGEKIKAVRFGHSDYEIKRDDPEKKKLYWERHNCSNANDVTTAEYWSCHWSWGKESVTKLLNENNYTMLKPIIINECVAVGYKIGDVPFLAKNRDRNYVVECEIIREVKNGHEIVIMRDKATDWMEGMNSAGIGIVNSALMIGRDENEKKIASKTGQKSKDGARILKALSFDNIDDVVESLTKFEGGIKGHTIVCDGEKIIAIEMTSKHDVIVKEKTFEEPIVRTNHGFEYQDAGYTEGDNYTSSVVRKQQAVDSIKEMESVDDIWDAMSNNKFDDPDNPYNMMRDTDNMMTTSQMFMNLKDLEFCFRPIEEKCNITEIINNYDVDNYEPKIKIRIIKQGGEDLKVNEISYKEKETRDLKAEIEANREQVKKSLNSIKLAKEKLILLNEDFLSDNSIPPLLKGNITLEDLKREFGLGKQEVFELTQSTIAKPPTPYELKILYVELKAKDYKCKK